MKKNIVIQRRNIEKAFKDLAASGCGAVSFTPETYEVMDDLSNIEPPKTPPCKPPKIDKQTVVSNGIIIKYSRVGDVHEIVLETKEGN